MGSAESAFPALTDHRHGRYTTLDRRISLAIFMPDGVFAYHRPNAALRHSRPSFRLEPVPAGRPSHRSICAPRLSVLIAGPAAGKNDSCWATSVPRVSRTAVSDKYQDEWQNIRRDRGCEFHLSD